MNICELQLKNIWILLNKHGNHFRMILAGICCFFFIQNVMIFLRYFVSLSNYVWPFRLLTSCWPVVMNAKTTRFSSLTGLTEASLDENQWQQVCRSSQPVCSPLSVDRHWDVLPSLPHTGSWESHTHARARCCDIHRSFPDRKPHVRDPHSTPSLPPHTPCSSHICPSPRRNNKTLEQMSSGTGRTHLGM